MRRMFLLSLCLFYVCVSNSIGQESADTSSDSGQSLFNSKDLSGWMVIPSCGALRTV